MYPVVEAVTALVFLLYYWQLGWQPLLGVRLFFAAAMVVLFTIDLQHHILPNVITLQGIVIGVAASLLFEPGLQASLIGVAVGGGVLWAVGEAYFRIRGEEGMQMGDIKMGAMIGAFLGWRLLLVTLLIAFLGGSVFGGGVILLNRSNMKFALPFLGLFLAADVLMVGAFLGLQFTPLVPLLAGPLASVGMLLTTGSVFLVILLGSFVVGALIMVGFFLAWRLTLLFALLTVPVIGLGMFLPNRDSLKFEVPFGSFLAVSAVITTYVGFPLLDWYLEFWS